jgi:hypothetical protein
MARPPKYTDELALKILEEISTTHHGLKKVCKNNDVAVSTVLIWLRDDKEFSTLYARAKESQADLLADEILAIADKERELIEETITSGGSLKTIKDNIARSRLQVDARKWLASKLKPKKYGDTQQADKSDSPAISFDDFINKIDNA